MTPETKILKEIINYLKSMKSRGQPIWWLKLSAGPFQRRGVPDLLVIFDERPFFFEIKAEGGRLTPLQAHVIKQLRQANAVAGIARSVKDVKRALMLD